MAKTTFATLPANPVVQPGFAALVACLTLAGLEDRAVRLSAADQRRVVGHPVFGKQKITLLGRGAIKVVRSVCFGMDTEVAEYGATKVEQAAQAGKKLSPGVTGPGYL